MDSPYQEIFRLSPLPMVLLSVLDGALLVDGSNPAYLELTGSGKQILQGEDFLSLLADEEQNPNLHPFSLQVRNSITQVLQTKEISSTKISPKNLEIHNTPIFDKNGKIEFIVHQVVPIQAQRTSQELLSSIINHTEECFILLDQCLLIASISQQFQKLYKKYFGIEMSVGDSILAHAQGGRAEFSQNVYQSVLAGHTGHSVIDIEFHSEIRNISLKYSPITNEKNEVTGVFVTAADLTEVKQIESQLLKSEQELSLIFENLTEVVFLMDVEDNRRFRFKSVNRSFLDVSGLSQDQVVGRYVEEVIPEPSLSLVLEKYHQAITTQHTVSWEEITVYPAGRKTGIVSVKPIFDTTGNCVELVGSVHDVTKLVDANEHIGKIMDSSLDVICTINKHGEFVTVSAAAERIWGYHPDALIGKPYLDLVYQQDRELTQAISQLIIDGLETTNFENRYIRKDGSIVTLIWSARWDKEEEIMYCTAKDGTDRLKSEKQLQQSEQRFKSLVQEGSDLIGILDLEGNYQYVSPTSMAVLGFMPEEFIANNAFDFIHPDDVENVSASFNRLGLDKRIEVNPFRFKHKNGSWRWIETILTDLSDEPSISGIVANSRDVTERINIQKTLILANERYKYVTKATSDAIWEWDLSSNELYWGEGFQSIFGYEPGGLAADISSWSNNIHGNDLERIINGLQAVIDDQDQTNWTDEYLFLKADGKYAFVQDKGFVIRDEQGKALRMVGALQDISRQKKEEQQLKLLESVITNTNDAILITEAEPIDKPGPRIIYVNNAFTKLTGYTADEVIGKTPRILQGPKTDRLELDRLRYQLQNWQPCEATLINYKKNGEEFWINFSITPVADEKGWFTHWISIERDVTESKNLEIQKILLADIARLFNNSQTLTETLASVLETIGSAGNFCAAEIWLVDEDKEEVNLLTSYSVDKKTAQLSAETTNPPNCRLGEGLPGKVWQSRVSQTCSVTTADQYIFKDNPKKAKIKNAIGVPLFNKDRINGVLILGMIEEKVTSEWAVLSSDFGHHLGSEIRRKQLEQELNQLFNFAPDIIAISNLDGYFKKINPAACSLLEYTMDEFLAEPIINFIHPDDRTATTDYLKSNQDSKGTYHFKNRYITKSGRVKWLAWASNILLDEGLIFSVAKDITYEKNLSELLLKSNSMGKVGSWEIDVLSGEVYWSDITHEIRETDPGFIPTLTTGIHYFREGVDKETITQKVNECKTHGTPWDEELQILTFKGNLKWIRTIGQAEMVNGKCIRIYGSFQDIDERKKAEIKVEQTILKLEESEKRYIDLFDLSPLPKWVYDIETLRFLDVNQAAIRHYGYSYEEFLSMTIRDIRPVEELPQLYEAIHISTATEATFYEGTFVHQNKRGERINVEIKSNVISFKNRMAKVVVANDITDRLAYFNALEQQNRKLQEISWIQSHIIRAPLSRLMGLVYLLKDKTSQIELTEELIIEHIANSAEELDQKIKEIIEKSDQREI